MTLAAFNLGAFLTASGVAVAGTAAIEVRREDTGALASIFSDEAGTTPIAQPGFQTDSTGRAIFYAAGLDRGYQITVTKGAETYAWRHVTLGTAGMRDDGYYAVKSGTDLTGTLQLSGDISPAQVVADTNDYNPTGLSGASVLNIDTDAERAFTGLAGGADGRIVVWRNKGSFNQVLKDQNTGSTAANRFDIGGSVRLLPRQSISLIYDSATSRWTRWDNAGLRQHGLCQLAKSGSNLVLSPKNGNTLMINGRIELITDAGVSLAPPSMTVTMTIATPAVATFNNHGLAANQPVIFNTSGALPTGVTAGTTYYAKNVTANTFEFSATPGGASINTTGTQSGTHTLTGPVHDIYAFMSAGVMTLEAQLTATAHAVQAGTGVEVKSGDVTRTLVGKARTVNAAWTDSATQRLVRSWFNDQGVAGLNTFSADRTTASTTFVELNAEIRVEFLTWAGDTIKAGVNGAGFINAAGRLCTGIAFDGSTLEANLEQEGFVTTAGGDIPVGLYGPKSAASEGYHFSTVIGRVSNGTGTWTSSSTTSSAKMYLSTSAGRSA